MKITIKNLQSKLPIGSLGINKIIHQVLIGEKIKKTGWINICFVTDPIIKKFNRKFHHTNNTTDVLAFDLSQSKKIIQADVIISTDTAIKQAAIFKTTPIKELKLYLIHAILHLSGYNDQNKKQIMLMRKTESKYVY